MNPSGSLATAAPGATHTGAAGLGVLGAFGLAALTLAVCGRHALAVLAGRARLDLPAFAGALRQAGLSMLPALSVIALAAGLILGQQSARLLASYPLPSPLLLTLTYALVIELVPVLVGVLVAGRAGVALAVHQATLVASGQADGLLVCGIDPIEYTTPPVLLAMLLLSFTFMVWGSLLALVSLFGWLLWSAEVPPALFAGALRDALTTTDLLLALSKPLVFALAIALVATVYGIGAGRGADGAARAATGTMIGAVAAILLLDLAYLLWPQG